MTSGTGDPVVAVEQEVTGGSSSSVPVGLPSLNRTTFQLADTAHDAPWVEMAGWIALRKLNIRL
jgi:hypothetical protein